MRRRILQDWFLSGGGGNLDTYATATGSIFLGNGTLDYPAFGGIAIQQSAPYRMCCALRLGSDHNSTNDGSIYVIFSDDGFETYEDASGVANQMTLVQAVGATLISNPTPFYTSTGRLIVFYSGDFYKYSDDGGITWSAQQNVNSSASAPFVGPGECIEVGGVLLKTMHDVVGPTGTYLFASTDDGLSFSLRSTMADTVYNFDEQTIVRLNNGEILALYRDNSAKKIWVNRSTDAGLTWSTPTITTIDGQSKAPIAISPNGNLIGLVRDPVSPFRTILLKATGDATDLNSAGYIDNREGAYVYGGVVWHPVYEKFIAVWFMEGYGTNLYSGPNLILKMDFEESMSAPTPIPTYNVRYRSSLDCAQAQPRGFTLPSLAIREDHNDLIEALNDNGITWDRIWIMAHNDTGLGNFSLVNLYSGLGEVATLVNSPTYGVNGYDFNGTNQRIDLGQTSRLSVSYGAYTRNSAGVFYWTPDTGADAAFGRNFGAGNLYLISHASDGLLYWRINDGTNSTITAPTGVKRYFLQRRDANDKRIWANGVQRGAVSVASVDISGASDNIAIGCINNGAGSFNNFSNKGCGIFIMGGANTGKELLFDTIVSDYLTARGLTP